MFCLAELIVIFWKARETDKQGNGESSADESKAADTDFVTVEQQNGLYKLLSGYYQTVSNHLVQEHLVC